MGLGIPSVVGPISEWLGAVPVEGCLPRAQVVVDTDDGSATVATGTSVGGRDLVPVGGAALRAGQRLVAMQTAAGESSAATPRELAVTVSASPTSHAQLPPMSFKSKLYACGAAVWLSGAAPGAAVTVSVGPTVLGTGRADAAGDARLSLTTHLPPAGAIVTAVQAAPPGFAPLAGAPQRVEATTIPVPLGVLPKPVVEDPRPMGCESSVRVGGVVDGAEVTVIRASDGSRATATFDLGELWFRLPKPFPSTGDRIDVSQALPRCEVKPSKSAIAGVRPAEAPESLDVAPPCAGSNYVHVGHLRPGATLSVAVDGNDPLRYVVPPERTVWDVPVEALPANAQLTVTLDVCGFSTSSTVTAVGDTPPPRPEVVEPLYSCGRAVSVKTRAGTYLELWADYGGSRVQISRRIRARRDLETIGVFPFLSVPESVRAHQLACSGGWVDGSKVDVHPHPRLRPLELREPVEGERAVLPTNVVSGAHVTVWASSREHGGEEIVGARDVTQADPVVGLVRQLSTDDVVWALEEMCGDRTGEGRHYEVTPGARSFDLPAPKEQLSGKSLDGKVVVHSAKLACRFLDGAWVFFADVENTETGYDCSLVFGVDVHLPSPLVLGESLDVDVAAAGGLPQGLSSLGYPSRWTQTRRGTDSRLQSPAFWREVLNASASWKMIVAWRNYAPAPDKPDWVKHGPPDPNQLFPPLPTENDDD